MTRRMIVDGLSVALIGDEWPEEEEAASEAVRQQVALVSEMAELADEYGDRD